MIPKKTTAILNTKNVALFLIFIGVALRLNHYFSGRSLWLDEAHACLDVLTIKGVNILMLRPFSLDTSIHPPLFRFLQKLFGELLWNTEEAFRFLPLIASIASLVFFYLTFKNRVLPKVFLIALGLLAFAEPLIYYAAEAKRYSVGVAMSVFLFWQGFRILEDGQTRSKALLLGVTGFLGLMMDYNIIFIIAAIGMFMVYKFIKEKKYEELNTTRYCFAFWALGIAIFLSVIILQMTERKFLTETAKGFLLQDPIWTKEGARWFFIKTYSSFKSSSGLSYAWSGLAFFLIGIYSAVKQNKRETLFLLLPYILLLMGTLTGKAPYGGRFLLFYVPFLMLFIAYGVSHTAALFGQYSRGVTSVLVILLFFGPVGTAIDYVAHPREKQEIRELVIFLTKNRYPTDSLYYNNSTQQAYIFYRGYYGTHGEFPEVIFDVTVFEDFVNRSEKDEWIWMQTRSVRIQKNFLAYYEPEPAKANDFGKNPRTWVLFSNTNDELKNFVLGLLDSKGTRLLEKKTTGAALYLYDLSQRG